MKPELPVIIPDGLLEKSPCQECEAKDKRIAELEAKVKSHEKHLAQSIELREGK